jgi:hypothetical protein
VGGGVTWRATTEPGFPTGGENSPAVADWRSDVVDFFDDAGNLGRDHTASFGRCSLKLISNATEAKLPGW